MPLSNVSLLSTIILTVLATSSGLSTNTSTVCTPSNQPVQCLTCPVGFMVNTAADGCSQCPTDCLECNATNCISCQTAYSLQNGICTPCDTGIPLCGACTFDEAGLSTCTGCRHGYSLVQDECQATQCPSNCDSCQMMEDGVECTACSEGYIINTDQSSGLYCLSCPRSCVNCHTNLGTLLCTECVPGYSLFEGSCQACTDPNSDCRFDNTGLEIVSACAEGFVLAMTDVCVLRGCPTGSVKNTNGVCTACPSSCISCVYTTNTDETNCVQCDTGYWVYQTRYRRTCEACVDNCDDCVSRTNCSQCATGYTPTTDGTCAPCPDRCIDCYYDDTLGSTRCLDCEIGNLRVQDICLECPTGCDRCFRNDTGLKCYTTACGAGFQYDAATASCSACPRGCAACYGGSGVVRCTACEFAYSLMTDDFRCAACQENCANCRVNEITLETACTLCKDKFALHSSGVCKACPVNCLSCVEDAATGDLYCDLCGIGYERTRGCIECPAGCSTCQVVAGATICTECGSGYVIDTASSACFTCGVFIPGCVSCSGSALDAVCDECYPGYALLDDGLACGDVSCRALGLPECETCAYTSCGVCEDGYKYDETDRTCKPACYRCTGEDGAYNKDCGSHGSEKEYDLEICEEGSCWVHLLFEDEKLRYRRGCYSGTCTDAYKLRVCTRYKSDDEEADEQKMECSRCCDTPGCNGFTLSTIDLSSAHKTISRISTTLVIVISIRLGTLCTVLGEL